MDCLLWGRGVLAMGFGAMWRPHHDLYYQVAMSAPHVGAKHVFVHVVGQERVIPIAF